MHCRGSKFTRKSLRQLAIQYNHIKNKHQEQFAQLREAGRLGTLAARSGHAAFGSTRSRNPALPTWSSVLATPVEASLALVRRDCRTQTRQRQQEDTRACQEFSQPSYELVQAGALPLPTGVAAVCRSDAPAAAVYPGRLPVIDFDFPATLLEDFGVRGRVWAIAVAVAIAVASRIRYML